MNEKDFIFLEHARAGIFNVFTALLCQPEKELIENSEIFDTLKSALSIVNSDCSKTVDQMEKAVKQNTVKDLLVEYTKLFIGPFKTLVPPYSSLYFGNDTLMSDQTVWVINFYRKSGLEFNEKLKEVPDHVAVETEFMYLLIHNEIKELDMGNRDKSFSLWENQREFFEKHYKKWVPKFCEKLVNETKHDYFKLLSKCLSKFINNVEIPAFPD